MSDDDLFVMLLATPFLLPILGPVVFGMWGGGREWMLERGFISPPEDAVWEIPGWDGAGVGRVHIVLAVCAILLCVMVSTAMARQRRRKRIENENWGIEP